MKPSRFILNTAYATLANDATGQIKIHIPASFTYFDNPLTGQAQIGGNASSGRISVSSSKYPGTTLLTGNISIPCTLTYYSALEGKTVSAENIIQGCVYKSGPNTWRMELRPNYPGDATGNVTVTNAEQDIIAHIATFVSPFEA